MSLETVPTIAVLSTKHHSATEAMDFSRAKYVRKIVDFNPSKGKIYRVHHLMLVSFILKFNGFILLNLGIYC